MNHIRIWIVLSLGVLSAGPAAATINPALVYGDSVPLLSSATQYFTSLADPPWIPGFNIIPVYSAGVGHRFMYLPYSMTASTGSYMDNGNGEEWRRILASNADLLRVNHLFSNYLPTVTASQVSSNRARFSFRSFARMAQGANAEPTNFYVPGSPVGSITNPPQQSSTVTATPSVTLTQGGYCISQPVSVFAANGNSLAQAIPSQLIGSEGPAPNPSQAQFRLPGDYCTY